MAKFKVSLVQLCAQDDLSVNINMVERYIREASSQGAKLVCLPENTFFMQAPGKGQHPDSTEAIDRCCALAVELKLWILIGSAHIGNDEKKSWNRSILVSDKGKIVAEYDKIHLFDVTLKNGEIYAESERISGGAEAVLANTPWGMMGMTVCYDLRFAGLYRTLAQAGATLIGIPAAFTYTTGIAHWHVLLRARAIETGCYIFAPAQCGIHPGNRRTYGHSLIVSPWGEIIAEASEDKTEIITAEIDTDKVSEARSMIPSLTHDRKFTLKKFK